LFALLQLQQKIPKHFGAISVFVPACEPIPLAPRGFDDLFFIERYYNLNPYTCGLSSHICFLLEDPFTLDSLLVIKKLYQSYLFMDPISTSWCLTIS
jgi:hypothetical protein